MRCPECNSKIKATNYEPLYEWYECPKCEGAFTHDEILEAEQDATKTRKSVDRRKRLSDNAKRNAPIAKGKKRQAEREADEELADEQVKAIVKKKEKHSDAGVKKHRDELPTGQVVNIMADEIQEIYHELGSELDEMNARDKALIIWRDLMIHGHVSAREQEVPMVLCGEHRG